MLNYYRDQQRRLVNELRANGPQPPPKATTVPIQADYEADPARCLTALTFVPAALSQAITQTILAPLQAIEPDHYYYPPAAMHVTIKNVRTIHDPPLFTLAEVEKVNRLFADLIPRYPAFSLWLEEIVPFSTSLAMVAYADRRFQELIQVLDGGLNEIGVPDNKQYISNSVFFGNMTLCRYVRPPAPKFLEAVARLAYGYQAELNVETIHLVTCNAVCSPASRQILGSYQLRS